MGAALTDAESPHLVVSCQTVDPALYQNQSELPIPILSELLQMLPHGDSLLDQVVQVFWDFWSQSVLFQDSEHLRACHAADLQ